MKVSVIIPAYNAEEFIKDSLNSVIHQVYKNLEIIVVDDHSTDNTKKIISEYAAKDKRIVPFYQATNKGVSAARNVGLKAATGDYIVFVDSDDYLTKDAIRRMVDASIEYNADYVDSYQLLYLKKKNGKLLSFTEKKLPKEKLVMGSINDDIRIIDMYTYIKGKLIKRELMKGLEFDESLSRYEDMVFEHELKVRIKNYVFLNKIIYFYFQREDSLVNTLGKKHLCFIDAMEKVKHVYINQSKEIQEKVEAMLFTNALLTLFTKVIKNDDSLEDDTKLCKESLKRIVDIFPNYEKNQNINKMIKKLVKKYLSNDKKLQKFVKKMRKIDFIKLYFKFLSIFNKYKYKFN